MAAGRKATRKAADGLTREDLQAIAADPLLRYEFYLPGQDGMSPGQEEIHRSQAQNRLVRAANQIGKTHSICAEVWWQATGSHPWRKISRKYNVAWCIIKDFESGYHVFCKKLRALEPPGVLHPNCTWDKATGYSYIQKGKRKTWLVLADGYTVEFKSGTQDVMSMESDTIDATFFDEPPKPGHWSAARSRLSASNGPTLIGFTAVGRPVGWLQKEVEGDPKSGEKPKEEWAQIVIPLSAANAPHRSPESIAAQIARTPAWEAAQRIYGGWEGVVEGRRFSAFKEQHVLSLSDAMEYTFSHFRLSGDYGEGPGKTAFYLEGIVGTREPYTYVVLGEYISQERTTPTQDGAGVLAMLKEVGIDPREIARAFGDVNSAGKLGAGASCNEEMERAIARLMKVQRCPFQFEVPDKGKGSVSFGEGAMSHAMLEDRFLVVEDCIGLLSSIRNYTGKEESLKHALDGVRYGISDLLAGGTPFEEQVEADYGFLLGRSGGRRR